MNRLAHALLRASLVLPFALAAAGCESPVDDDLIAAQGGEVDGLEEGEFHRYGQDCLACHGGYGGGPRFVAAGTVFATPTDDIPVAGATIYLTDVNGKQRAAPSNCAGNFYFQEDANNELEFPLRVEIECPLPDGTTRRALMGTRINRDGGCAFCHQKGGANSESPGQVYCSTLQPEPAFAVPAPCEGGPASVAP